MIYGPLSIFTIFVPFYVSNQINLFADSNNLSWRCMFRLMESKLDPSTITWFLWRWFSLIKAFIDKFLDFDMDIRMAFFFSLFRTCIIHNGDACIVYTKRSIFLMKEFGPLWCGCLPTDSTEQILEHKTSVQLVVENSNGDIRCANTIAIVLSIHLRAACNPFHHILKRTKPKQSSVVHCVLSTSTLQHRTAAYSTVQHSTAQQNGKE